MEDSSLSQLEEQDQSNFIVLPSQDETQQSFQCDNKMADYLKKLPALQNPETGTSKLGLNVPSDTGEEGKKGKVLVPDSEYDSERHVEHTEPSDYVSESEDEDHGQNDEDTSEDHGEVTVIQKANTDKEGTGVQADKEGAGVQADKEKAEGSNPSSESSFQSKNRSNLGSYDQCELYKTQSGHAKGYRFNLFASSQEDMFATADNPDAGEGAPVSTPAEHLGSLHLSQKPMLVPETMEETGNAISPSPEVYGSTPIIIPSSPTQNSQGYGDEASMFDVNAVSTLAENSKGFEFGDSSNKENSSGSKGTKTPDPESASVRKSPIDIDEALQMATLVDDDKSEHHKSKRGKRTKQEDKNQQKSSQNNECEERSDSPIIISLDAERPASRTQDDDIIMIPSGTMETQQDDQSQQLFLHLTPSQDGTTQGQRSQGRLSLGMSGSVDKGSQQQSVSEINTDDENPHADNEPVVQSKNYSKAVRSQTSQKNSQIGERSSQGHLEVTADEGQVYRKRSQGEGSESQRSNKSSESHKSESQKSEKSQKRREEKRMADVNDNPLVVWREESDTDQFHLTLPKDGSLLHPTGTMGDQSEAPLTSQSTIAVDRGAGIEKSQVRHCHRDSIQSEDSHREESLALGAIQSESEPVTQPTFRLEKPALADTEVSQEAPEDLFVRSSPRQVRPHTRYILEDDSDEEDSGPSHVRQGEPSTPQAVARTGKGAGPSYIQEAGGADQRAGPSMMPEDDTGEVYVAQKLDLGTKLEESVDDTQPYDPKQELFKDSVGPATADNAAGKEGNIHTTEGKHLHDQSSERQTDVHTGKTVLVQTSTQTQEAGPQITMETGSQMAVDINVVQKVAEYLQTGYSPRSRSSSSCTDLSDLQGSEKSEGQLKTVTPKRRDRHGSSASLGRRDSADKRSPKSPKEIQNIINTYSSILNKGKGKLPTPGSHTLQREVSITESVKSVKDNRDATVETVRPPTPALVRRDSSSSSLSATKPVLTADKTKGDGHSQPDTPRVKAPARKDLSQQYGGTENSGFSPIPEALSPKPQQAKELGESTRTPGNTININNPKPTYLKEKHSAHSKDKHSTGKHRVKRRLSPSERSERRRSVDSASPRLPSGAFVASTQKFSTGSTPSLASPGIKLHRGDTFEFHGTQSQGSPEEATSSRHESLRKSTTTTSPNYAEKTPLSSRKRSRLQHRKSGLKKSKSDSVSAHGTPEKPHVSFKNMADEPHDQPVSQKSDTTTATIGSLPSLPSSISSPGRDYIMSPSSTSSGSRQSVRGEVSARLSGKRMSIEPALPDSIPLPTGEEENYQLVTEETHIVRTVYDEVTTTKRLIGAQGQILESSVEVHKNEPRIMEESTHKKMRYVYIASPSRSAASLTSGDLADISSSLSRSSVSSGSLGSKGNTINRTTSSSLEAGSLERQTSDSHTEGFPKGQSNAEGDEPIAMETAELGKGQEKRVPSDRNAAQNQLPAAPEAENQKPRTPVESAPATPNLPEVSVVITPLGSTINKTGSSYLHSRTASMESPKTSDSLFTSPEERRIRQTLDPESGEKKAGTLPEDPVRQTEGETHSSSTVRRTERQSSSSDDVSSEIPHQDQAVSSSSPSDENSLVPSSGVIGCRVMAKWRDSFFYPGTLKSSTDRSGKCRVCFDDGDSMCVKVTDILLVERLAVGQSVMVLTDNGDFECGMISRQRAKDYLVAKDEGGSGRFTHSQVILSEDQASCIISDAGSEILLQQQAGLPGPGAQAGEISLDNLVDEPRRSAKKPGVLKVIPEEAQNLPSTSKGRKRKIEELKPKATSTPTPKGKAEMARKKRKVMDVDESPIETPQSSPVTVRRCARKARDRLFQKDIGPLPSKKLFRGLTFLLTNVEKSREQREFEQKLLQDSSLDISTDESAAEEEINAPFDKDHLKAQIEAGGGVCLDTLDEKMVGKKKCYLLSSSYQRTIKYLQCLASGIPCVSHMWLVDSCTQGQLLDEKSYILPNGVSLEKRKVMEWKGKKDTFIGIKAAVYSKNVKFVETWTHILNLGQCSTHKQLQYSEIHVIVTDSSCSAAVKRQAASHSVPLVSMEWVIQSLVNSKAMPFDGHVRYGHDFTV